MHGQSKILLFKHLVLFKCNTLHSHVLLLFLLTTMVFIKAFFWGGGGGGQ
jgi:hypothetical protein